MIHVKVPPFLIPVVWVADGVVTVGLGAAVVVTAGAAVVTAGCVTAEVVAAGLLVAATVVDAIDVVGEVLLHPATMKAQISKIANRIDTFFTWSS
jgi:hypothetical protein